MDYKIRLPRLTTLTFRTVNLTFLYRMHMLLRSKRHIFKCQCQMNRSIFVKPNWAKYFRVLKQLRVVDGWSRQIYPFLRLQKINFPTLTDSWPKKDLSWQGSKDNWLPTHRQYLFNAMRLSTNSSDVDEICTTFSMPSVVDNTFWRCA